MKRFQWAAAAAAVTLLSGPAGADDVTETIESALKAYQDGDIQYALEELSFATQLLKAMKTESLSAFLPEAPDGWTRTIDEDFAAGMSYMGGGVGASAEYSDGSETIKLTLMADNPMVASMGAMLANAGLMGGKMIRVGREKFVEQNNEIMGLIGNRVLVQASGGGTETVVGLLETIDLAGLGSFGS